MSPITRAYEAEIDDVLPGERSVIAIINTADVDRFRTVIDSMGGDFRAYRSNPVVLWEHGLDPVRGRVPVGRSGWIKPRRENRDIIGKTIFGKDEFSENLFRLYQDGTLRGFSVSFTPDPKSCSPPTAAEIRSRPDLAGCQMMYRAWSLNEYSCVAIPGNKQALALAVSRGLWVPDAVRGALAEPGPEAPIELPPLPPKVELPPLVGRSFRAVLEARRAALRAEQEDLIARLELRRGIV